MGGENGTNIEDCPLVRKARKQIEKATTIQQASLMRDRAQHVLHIAEYRLGQLLTEREESKQ